MVCVHGPTQCTRVGGGGCTIAQVPCNPINQSIIPPTTHRRGLAHNVSCPKLKVHGRLPRPGIGEGVVEEHVLRGDVPVLGPLPKPSK